MRRDKIRIRKWPPDRWPALPDPWYVVMPTKGGEDPALFGFATWREAIDFATCLQARLDWWRGHRD